MKNVVPFAPRILLWLGLLLAFSVMAKTFTATFFKDVAPSDFPASALVSGPDRTDDTKQVSQASLSAIPASPQTAGTCSLTLNRVDVSGCYSVSGLSKATISVEVGWQNSPTNDYIVVTTAGQSRTIVPGITTITYPQPTTVVIQGTQNIVTPQVVAFEVTLTGAASSSTVTAKFVGSASCQDSKTFALPAACPPTSCSGLGGVVYRDFNANGTQQATETQGVSSVSVTAYDCNGAKYGPVMTDQFGKYTFSNPSIKYPVRVEFSDPAGLDVSTVYGANSKSSVQFVSQASCAVNLGIANPTLYCQDNPTVFIPCYTYGDPLNLNPTPPVNATALSGNTDALVSFPYDESSTAAMGMTPIAEAQVTGTVWGLGYNRLTKDLFVSATLHRHSGLGPLGIGGIYVTHTKSGSATTQSFIDVSTIGINVGTVPVNGAGGRGLSADKTKPSNDVAVFSLIGKVGIGGLEVSEDGQQLWFVNLFDKKLYSIDISAYNTSGTKPTSANVKSYTIPDPACSGGSSRPWALHIASGKLYVGSVCDALTSKNKSDLRAYVYAFDISTSTFSSVFDFPLTYPKGYGISPLNSPGQAGADSTGWYPWTDSFSDLIIATSTASYKSLVHPQPMLADIDIDVDGSMVLGFGDRTGMQGGYNNYNTNPTDTQLYTVNPAAGDVLRAYYSNGSYILENNGKAGPFSGTGVGNKQGPGSGEFYADNYTSGGRYVHTELALGGLALRPGSGHVVGATIDPIDNIANSGGVKYWNNETGVAEAAALIYTTGTDPGTFAKAAGLGEPDLNCDLLQVIEIGNRVWIDTDQDGIQGACEPILSGVNVSLYKSGTLVATTTTNGNGEYYFSSKSKLTSGTWSGTGADTTLRPTLAYQVVFGNGQFANGTLTNGTGKYQMTLALSTAPTASTINDSNVTLATVAGNSLPTANVTTGSVGSVDHTIDAGFICAPTTVGSLSVTPATCTGNTANSNGRISLTGIQNGEKAYLYTVSPAPSYTAAGSQPVSASAVSFTGLANPSTSAGQSYSIIVYNGPNCFTIVSATLPQTNCTPCGLSMVVTPGLCQSATNSYVLSGTITATNVPTSGTLTITSTAFSPRSLTLSAAANASGTLSYSGLVSNGQAYTVTASYSNSACSPVSQTYTAPVSCSVAPVCSLSATTTAGLCTTATNTYSATVVATLTNAVAGTVTISIPGTTPISQSIVANTPSVTVIIPGLISDGAIHTATVSLPGCGTTTANFTAPLSCSVAPVCSISASATPSICTIATNTYSVTALITVQNPPASGTVSVSTSGQTIPFSTTANSQNTFTAVFTGLISDGASHIVTVSLPGCSTTTTTYTAPASCSVAPVCSLTATATPSLCTTATNTYSSTAVVQLTNPTAGTLTITDGPENITFVTTVAGSATFTAVFTSLIPDGLVHTVTVSLPGCSTTTATYTAPASCSVDLVCSLTATATPSICATATNTYSATAVVRLTNPTAGTLTVTNGAQSLTFATTAVGSATYTATFNGLVSDGTSHSVVASLPGCSTTTVTYTAPASCSVAPICSLSAVATQGICASATNTFSNTVTVTLTNPVAGTLTVSEGVRSITFVVPASVGTTIAPAIFNGIPSDGLVHTVTVSLPGCGTTTATYTAPRSCTQPAGTQLAIDKLVNKSKAKVGDVLTYTIVLTNSGNASATNVVVTDSATTGLTYLANSATAPTGTTFTHGTPSSTWTVPAIAPGQSLSLTFQAIADSSGILYNKASIPGDTATVCTSIPFRVCAGSSFLFRLTAPPGRSSYKWYKDNVELIGQTSNVLSVTAPGTYSLAVDNVTGQCPDFSCCPFIVEEDTLPTFQATAIPVTCVGNTPQANGQLVLAGFNPAYTYQYSLGTSFNEAAVLSGPAQVIPVGGVIVNNLANPVVAQSYTIRVYNGGGCYTDVTVLLLPTVCDCPAQVCVPLVIKQTRGVRRNGL